MTQTLADPAAEIARLNGLIDQLNGVNTTLYEQYKYRGELLEEANNHRGILQTALQQRDAEIAALKAKYEPPPVPTPEPEPEPEPSPDPQPEPVPLPVDVQDLTLEPAYLGIEYRLAGSFPPAQDVGTVEYREAGGEWKEDVEWTIEDGQPLARRFFPWSVGDELLGSIRCTPNTEYEVRLVTPDGVRHVGATRTLDDARVPHAALVGIT